ncbi:hypothetical protein M438DRAFT_405315 [Aureobasidium pullulans EXF-150]|uniref:WSC domain-containing protein n=1 Tax=Aureobasidium pullulans EXF-150 TaxID=1043002 RepID=A0A074XHL2_AURPU|nr:uncharacterized protein M438DRAFT_405315 [Aureobasidium pullulans EXF-150]KEQ84988.1 hypothetical protein M438DRAFT_405315 [Aureobasidium pullulans EXF-150]
MKQAAIFGSVLGFAALVAAGPILRSGAINALQSSEKGLNKENNFDDLLEDFVATLNYPADMMKGSVGLEDNFSRGEFLEAVTLKNGDAFEAYIDHMDDDAVRKALVSAEMYTDFYNGPKGAFDNKNDSGIAKRDFSDWCHNKCKFKAAFHSNSDKYYCGCFDDCTFVTDLTPDYCKQYSSETSIEKSGDNEAYSTIEARDTVNVVDIDNDSDLDASLNDDFELDTGLIKRSGLSCHFKCKSKAAWHHDMEAYYCKCITKCEKDVSLIPDCCKAAESCDDEESMALFKRSIDTTPVPAIEAVDTVTPVASMDINELNDIDNDSDLDASLNDDFELDTGLIKRSGLSCHFKCKTKAAWHRDMEAYYCKCINKCEKNKDLIPDCCKENTESCNDDESAISSDSSRDPSILLPTPPMPPIPSTLPTPLPTSKSPVPSTPPMPLPKSTSPADTNASSGSFQKCNFKCNFKVFFKSNYTRDECMSNCLGFAYTTPTPPPGSSGKSVRRCDFKCDFKVFFKSNYSYDTCMSDCLGYAFTTPQAPKVTADDTVVTDEANDNFLEKLYGGGKDKDLTRRSSAGKSLYRSANPCDSASAVQKCRTKAAWHWHSKKHYDDCMHECNMKHSQGA